MSIEKDCNFSYVIDNPDKNDYFRLDLLGANLIDNLIINPNALPLNVYNGLSSALELCNRKVRISINVKNDLLKGSLISISSLLFRDNFNKIYEVEIGDFKS